MGEEMNVIGEAQTTPPADEGQQTPPAATGGEGAQSQTTPPAGEEMIPKSRVEALISQRVNETRQKFANHDKYSKIVENISRATGMTPEAIEAQLSQMEIEQQAQQSGMDPMTYQQMMMANSTLQQAAELNATTRLSIEEERLIAKDPIYQDLRDNNEVRESVHDYARQMGVSLEQAYWAVNGAQKMTQIRRETEQQAITRMKQQSAYGGVISDGGTGEELSKLGLSPEQVSAATRMGLTPQEYAQFMNMENLGEYQNSKKKK